ncbi:flagellar hook-length control protein FliK [Caulobacter sp. S45]|uniref:flagellar hook-length control protein FliK n=1 Tax=Caulobacter sp. S45 TaxID=1641861 RepID=UPI00131C384B|nr:flagellar hook-length control protein FliK [Caulobacter sp. S45]
MSPQNAPPQNASDEAAALTATQVVTDATASANPAPATPLATTSNAQAASTPPNPAPTPSPSSNAAVLLQAAGGGVTPASLSARAQDGSQSGSDTAGASAAAGAAVGPATSGWTVAQAAQASAARSAASPKAAPSASSWSASGAAKGDPAGSGSSADPADPAVVAAAHNPNGSGHDAASDDGSDADAGDDSPQAFSASASSGADDLQGLGFALLGTAPVLDAGSAGSSVPSSATAADLGGQIATQVSAGGSQFQLQLNPGGLGQVTVTVQIGANRQLTASLAFEHQDAASALSAHSDELQKSLEQAGFSVAAGGFSFTVHHTPTAQASATSSGGASATPNSGGFTAGGGGQSFGDSSASNRQAAVPLRLAQGAFVSSDDLQTSAPSGAWGRTGADSRLDIRI